MSVLYYCSVQLTFVSDYIAHCQINPRYSESDRYFYYHNGLSCFPDDSIPIRRLIERDRRVQIHRGEFAQGSNCDWNSTVPQIHRAVWYIHILCIGGGRRFSRMKIAFGFTRAWQHFVTCATFNGTLYELFQTYVSCILVARKYNRTRACVCVCVCVCAPCSKLCAGSVCGSKHRDFACERIRNSSHESVTRWTRW